VAGISSDGVGYKNIIIRPNPDKRLQHATASYDSIHGLITSSWENNGDITTYTIFIPVNTLATVYLPGQKESIKVGSGISIWKIKNK
jgi:alpha-L-rhamnosidase